MKQKDWALVLVMAFVGGVFALFISNFLFASPKNRQQKAEIVDAISASFPQPPSQYFNKDSVNPTQPVRIGNSTNPNPFNSKDN
jgi:hypothetical protein